MLGQHSEYGATASTAIVAEGTTFCLGLFDFPGCDTTPYLKLASPWGPIDSPNLNYLNWGGISGM